MNTYVLIIVNVIYYLLGKDMYKKLRSYPNLKDTIINLAATLKRLDEVATDDESVIPGRDEYITSYKFFKGNIFNLISYKYLILNENFRSVAINGDDFRISRLLIKADFINKFIVYKFDLKSLGLSTSDFDKINFKDNNILTALKWNSLWEDILFDSRKEKTLENLSSQYLLLNQIPGIVAPITDEMKTKNADPELNEGDKFVGIFHDFRNTSEFNQEFALICCHDDEINKLSPSKTELTSNWIDLHYDIHTYLFNDI